MRLFQIALITTSVLLGNLASAQTPQTPNREDVLKGIEECASLSVEFMRAACLEAANQFLETNTPPAQTLPSPSQAQTNDLAEIETARAALEKERAQIEQDRAALAAQTQVRSENERLGLLARLGLARNAEVKDEQISATITIERVTYNRQNIHTFYTSDGDIIRQDPRALRMRLPENFPATATLERRTFGSKWLTFTDNPERTYKVNILTPKD